MRALLQTRCNFSRAGSGVSKPRGQLYNFTRPSCLSTSAAVHPINVLFCGSDEFSIGSLEKLDTLRKEQSEHVSSITVVTKKGKPSGRGHKIIKDAPIKSAAERLSLRVHEIATFTGWSPPAISKQGIDLVVAVSFGLLVPPRILNLAKYGGINVHPSLLPDLRGPAPLQHTLMQGRRTSGITVQTLHPKHFDRGDILAQVPLELPDAGKCSFDELRDYMAFYAGVTLCETIKQGLFLPPLEAQDSLSLSASEAPKVVREDGRVAWQIWTSDKILQVQRGLGTLWSVIQYEDECGSTGSVSLQWQDLAALEVTPPLVEEVPGTPFLKSTPAIGDSLIALRTMDGRLVTPRGIKVEGRPGFEDPMRVVAMLIRKFGRLSISHS